jgi:hypothetical protein
LPIVALIAAFAFYFGWIAPGVAKEHRIILELPKPTEDITRIDTLWVGVDLSSEDAAAGATFRFSPGQAPCRLKTVVHAPAGPYWLEMTITRAGQASTIRQRVMLESDEVTVYLRGDEP